MNNDWKKLVFASCSTLLLGSIAACGGGSDSSAPNNTDQQISEVSETKTKVLAGYYELTEKASNGDDILRIMVVKPNGQYWGFFNNSFVNTTTYQKEVFSQIQGQFEKADTNFKARMREFDSSNNTVSTYQITGSVIENKSLTFNALQNSGSLDKTSYTLPYVEFDGQPISAMIGNYKGIANQLSRSQFLQSFEITAASSNKKIADISAKFANCDLTGTLTDKDYTQKYYDFTATSAGDTCEVKGKYTGVGYMIGKRLLIMSTNSDNTETLRFIVNKV